MKLPQRATSAKLATPAPTATSATAATTTRTASASRVSATATWTRRCPPASASRRAGSASAACTTPLASTARSARTATCETPRAPTAPGKVTGAPQSAAEACRAPQMAEGWGGQAANCSRGVFGAEEEAALRSFKVNGEPCASERAGSRWCSGKTSPRQFPMPPKLHPPLAGAEHGLH